jgi:hypothetical protein
MKITAYFGFVFGTEADLASIGVIADKIDGMVIGTEGKWTIPAVRFDGTPEEVKEQMHKKIDDTFASPDIKTYLERDNGTE